MKIRRYTCANMQEALLKVKMDLGSEAVIMNSRKVKKKGLLGVFSKPMIEVVAAIDDDYVKPSRPHPQMRAPQAFQENAPPAYAEPPREQPQPVYQQPQPAYNQNPQQTYQQSAPSYNNPQPCYNQTDMQQRDGGYFQHRPAPAGQGAGPSQQGSNPIGQKPVTAQQPPASTGKPQENKTDQRETFDPKIAILENKVKSMETMLEEIYKSVNDRKAVPEALPEEGKAGAAETGTDGLSGLKSLLSEYEIDSKLIEKIIEKVKERGGSNPKPEEAITIAARVMTVLLGEPEVIIPGTSGAPRVAIFVGPTGVGKTTTLAKIAADFTLNKQKKVGLITADTYRIAAVEQLKTYAEILNIPVMVVYSPNEIRESIKKFSDKDLILIDTAGRSHRNKTHFDELKALVGSVAADETYLVVSANTGKSAVKEILEYYSFIKNFKLLFTKLDEVPAPSVIVNARYFTGKAISYTTAGQSVPDDLDVADPRAIVAGILKTNI